MSNQPNQSGEPALEPRSRFTWDLAVLICCAAVSSAAAFYQLAWNPATPLTIGVLIRKLFLPCLLWLLAIDQLITGKRRFLNGAARRKRRGH